MSSEASSPPDSWRLQDRRLSLLQYFENERTDRGVPFLLLAFDTDARNAPYLECFRLEPTDGSESNPVRSSLRDSVPSSLHEYLDGVLSDIQEASKSREETHLLVVLLEHAMFGPIRGKRVDEALLDSLLNRYKLQPLSPVTSE